MTGSTRDITPRRAALKTIAMAIAGIGAARIVRAAGDTIPHLTDSNPAAAALDYTEDTDDVDPRKYPKHTAQQRCANCKYFDPRAGAGGPYAPCRLYPGNAVNINGWCAGYAPPVAAAKSATG